MTVGYMFSFSGAVKNFNCWNVCCQGRASLPSPICGFPLGLLRLPRKPICNSRTLNSFEFLEKWPSQFWIKSVRAEQLLYFPIYFCCWLRYNVWWLFPIPLRRFLAYQQGGIKITKFFLRDLLKHPGYCSALEFFPGGQFYSNSISVSLLQRSILHS